MPVVDILQAFEKEPQPLDFVWHGYLAGSVGALVAPGATSKTFWTVQAAMSVAAGCEADLIEIEPGGHGKVLYLAAEDPIPAIQHRLHAIGKHLPESAREAVGENLTLQSVLGDQLDLMSDKTTGQIIEQAKDCRLVVLDTLSRLHRLDENSNGEMARLVARMEHIAVSTGAAILFLHHTSKAAALTPGETNQQAGRGASSLVDNSRWVGSLRRMSEEEGDKWLRRPHQPVGAQHGRYVRWSAPKQNYSKPVEPRWYERVEGGVLLPVDLKPVEANGKQTGNSGRKRNAA